MRVHRSVLLVCAATAAAVPALVTVAGAAPAPAGFSSPVVIPAADDLTDAAEPSIEVDSHGQVYVSGPASLPFGGCPFWEVDPDKGTYSYRGTIDTDHLGTGGGDCDISLSDNPTADASHDQVSVTSLWLGNLTSNTSSDGGATWSPVANPVSQQAFAVDRQWQASDRSLDRHYLTVHDLATSNIQTSVSIDGGFQYVQNTPAVDPTVAPQALSAGVLGIRGALGGNSFGTTVVDETTHKLYVPFIAPLGNTFEMNAVYVAEGDPCAVTPCEKGLPAGPISWTNHLAYVGPLTAGLGDGFPAIALDGDGVLHLAWTGDASRPASAGSGQDANRVFTIHSRPRDVSGGAWSAPQAVDPGTAHANVFPWMVAGAGGRVGIAWYTSTLGPTPCPATQVAGPTTDVQDACNNAWTVAYAESHDANGTAPTWSTTQASPGVIHRGSICVAGLDCPEGTRTLLDFFDVALDAAGRPNIVFNSDVRRPGTADIQVTRQCSGTSLTGVDLVDGCGGGTGPSPSPTTSGTVCPGKGAGFADKPGDATEVLLTGETPADSDPAVDLLNGDVGWDAATSSAVFTTRVGDLRAAPSLGDGYFRWQVSLAGDPTLYNVSTTVPADGGPPASELWSSALDVTSQAVPTVVERATGVITVTVPSTAYVAARSGNTALTADRGLDVVGVLGQRAVDLVVTGATLTADTAETLCDASLAQPVAVTASPTATATVTPSPSASATATPSPTATATAPVTPTPTCTPSGGSGGGGGGGGRSSNPKCPKK